VTLGVSIFRVEIPLRGSEWADRYFYLSPESSGTEGRWKCYPYQIGPLNWMTSDDIEEVNGMKSRRVGYTKMLLAAIGCLIHQKRRNVATWQPTDGDAADFVRDEVETALRDVPALGAALRSDPEAKSKFNTIDKKVFIGATWDIKGGKSAKNFRRMSKDVASYDELAAFDPDIDGEGSALELGDGRLDQAPFPKSIRGSTPKIKGLCQIEAAVEASDMVFHRYIRCKHCGALHRLEFKNLKWDEDRPGTAYFVCPTNGCTLLYRDYPEMDASGRWQTIDGNWYDDATDRFFNADDQPIDKPRRIGWKIWAAYSYLRPWSWLADRWIQANKEAKTGKVTALKAVINTLLGETWEERGETIEAAGLADRGEDYLAGGTIPMGVLVITAGVDVQGGLNARLECEIVGHGLEGETWSLGYEVIPGNAEWAETWEALDAVLERRFVREDGVTMRIDAAFIDSGFMAHHVYRYTAKRRRRNIYATKGVNTGTLCNKGTWQGDQKKGVRAILRTVNVDDAKTVIFNRLRIQEPGPGYCHFPDHYQDDYFEKLTNEQKVEKRNKRGALLGYEWVKKGPNEPLDCRAYALGAFEFRAINLGKRKLMLERMAVSVRASVLVDGPMMVTEVVTGKVEDGPSDVGPVTTEMMAERAAVVRNSPKKKAKKRAGGGFVNRWKW
jgi:phage terminase large subunit GpA-like protein